MTEWQGHNGGGSDTAEPAAAAPVRRRGRVKKPRQDGETPPRRSSGSWFAWNAAGEMTHYGSELAAAQFALTPPADGATYDAPPSVEFVEYGAKPSR